MVAAAKMSVIGCVAIRVHDYNLRQTFEAVKRVIWLAHHCHWGME